MLYDRTDKLLTNETGVLSGSQYFISTKPASSPHLIQYLFTCGHYHCVPGYQVRRDYYKYLLLGYVVEGELLVEYNQKTKKACKGDVVCLDCQTPHFYAAGNSLEFLWAHVEGNIARQFCREINQKHGAIITSDKNIQVKNGLAQMVDAYRQNAPLPTGETSALLYSMFCGLYSSVMKSMKMSNNQLVMASIQFMRYNLVNEISEADIAASIGMEPKQYHLLFAKATGHSPSDYLVQLRIGLAQHFFATTDQSIHEVMGLVGYSRYPEFEKAFVELTGKKPAEYSKTS